MKMLSWKIWTTTFALLFAGVLSHISAATWGSIHANNRSAPRAPSAPSTPRVEHGHEVRPQQQFRPAPAPNVSREHERSMPEVRNREEFDRGHQFEGNRAREAEHVWHEQRHADFDWDRHHAYYWSHYHPGFIVNTLPFGYVPIYVGGAPYYYYQGVYYNQGPSGYAVAAAPIGAVVPELPPGAETVLAGDVPYYYAGGAFYVQVANGFQVAEPPLGVTVTSLPPDAAPVTINGTLFYSSGGIYYMPTMQDGVTVYTTVRP